MGSVTRNIRRNIIRGKLERHKFTNINKRMSSAWWQYFHNGKVRDMLDK